MLLLLHMAACLAAVHSQGVRTVDTQQPIIRSVPPDQDDYAYFGYSVVLHQMSPNTGSTSMVEALSNTRCVSFICIALFLLQFRLFKMNAV